MADRIKSTEKLNEREDDLNVKGMPLGEAFKLILTDEQLKDRFSKLPAKVPLTQEQLKEGWKKVLERTEEIQKDERAH